MIPPSECKWGLKFLELKVTYSWFHNDRRWKKYARSLSLDSNRRQGFATRKKVGAAPANERAIIFASCDG